MNTVDVKISYCFVLVLQSVLLSLLRLDQELDFIMSQQRDLEDMLTPLEESLRNASHVTSYEQHADHEREKT